MRTGSICLEPLITWSLVLKYSYVFNYQFGRRKTYIEAVFHEIVCNGAYTLQVLVIRGFVGKDQSAVKSMWWHMLGIFVY